VYNLSEGEMMAETAQTYLSRRICDLHLKIQGTRLEEMIADLYIELERAGINFRPGAYLSDGWGCPNLVPVIGIPFFLANTRLRKLKGQLTGFEVESDTDLMMILRHESGHAFNYAYRIYEDPKWQEVFGRFSNPYKERYKARPFNAGYVRHVAGWYVQKHPDEDFAETFAVWLTPGSNWREKYKDAPSLAKLLFIDSAVNKFGKKEPVITGGKLDLPLNEITETVETWFDEYKEAHHRNIELHNIIDEDLKRLLPSALGKPANEILNSQRKQLIKYVNYWTGIDRDTLIALIDNLLERIKQLGLKIRPGQKENALMSISAFIATLAMNYVGSGKFIDS
jgi:hypothetical protein